MITLIERIKEHTITYKGEDYLLSSDMQKIMHGLLLTSHCHEIAQNIKYYPIGYSERIYAVKRQELFDILDVDNLLLLNS